MLQEFTSVVNATDSDDNPSGGEVHAKGLDIVWQSGPLGRGEDRKEPNGAFVETVIEAARQRLIFYQDSKFNCAENQEAIDHLSRALQALEFRTQKREDREVEGTHEV